MSGPATAQLIDDRTLLHQKGNWSTTYDVYELPEKIAFYERLRDRNGPHSQPAYQSDVDALTSIHSQIKEKTDGSR